MRITYLLIGFICYLICLQLVNLSKASAAEPIEQIRVWKTNAERQKTKDFLLLAIEKSSPQYGAAELTPVEIDGYQNAFASLELGQRINIMVSAVNADYESRALPVYVPLDRGLLGFRVCVINNQHYKQFELLANKQGFIEKKMRVGLGLGWPDADIMRANQVNVSTFNSSNSVLQALKNNTIDCYSRSVGEVMREPLLSEQIVIEENMGLIYPLTDIIYVSKKHPKLHARLLAGLNSALEDGSFNTLMKKHYAMALSATDFYFRNLIIIDNPNITPEALQAINHFGIASFNKAVPQR